MPLETGETVLSLSLTEINHKKRWSNYWKQAALANLIVVGNVMSKSWQTLVLLSLKKSADFLLLLSLISTGNSQDLRFKLSLFQNYERILTLIDLGILEVDTTIKGLTAPLASH